MIVYDRSEPPRTVALAASQKVHIGPALIVSAYMSGTGATPDAQVYDGLNDQGRKLFDLRCVVNEGASFPMGPGIECLAGIYVAIDASTTLLTLSYYPGNEVAPPA